MTEKISQGRRYLPRGCRGLKLAAGLSFVIGAAIAGSVPEGEFWNTNDYVVATPVKATASFAFPFDATSLVQQESAANDEDFSTLPPGLFIILR